MKQFDPFYEGHRADPFSSYAYYRERDSVHWGATNFFGRSGSWYVFGHKEVLSGLQDDRFAHEAERTEEILKAFEGCPELNDIWYWMSHSVQFVDPPRHTRLRTMLAPYFTGTGATDMATWIEATAHELIDALEGRRQFDLVTEYAQLLPCEVTWKLIGLNFSGREDVRTSALAITRALDCVNDPGTIREGAIAMKKLTALLEEEVQRHKRAPRPGIMGELLDGPCQDGSMSNIELIANLVELVFAGLETTSLLIGSAVELLLRNPKQLALFQCDPSLDRRLVGEVMRYAGPSQMVGRVCMEDIEFCGRQLHKGDAISFMLGSANRDPAVFSQPDDFDITRKEGKQAGFAFGRHFCIGATLARVESMIALRVLFERLPHLKLVESGMKRSDRIAFYGPAQLLVNSGAA